MALTGLRAGKDVVGPRQPGQARRTFSNGGLNNRAFAKRALFTVPTRALANDKFAEWNARDWNVGHHDRRPVA